MSQGKPAPPSWAAFGDAVVLVGAGWLLFALLSAWWARVPYPFDLEWMEGGMLAHGWRLQRGLPLYADPTADWVPYVYPPGYSALLAASGSALGYGVGRGLSVLGILAAAGALVQGVGRLGRSYALGLLAAAAFLMTYRASGAFFDLVRPDSVAIALGGWAIVLATDGRRGTDVAGGLLLAAAFLVKHNLAAFGVPLALGLWAWHGWRTAMRFGLSAMLPALFFTGYLQWRSGGGFLTYLLAVPGSHPMMWDRGLPGSPGETGHWLWPMLVVAGVGLASSAVPRGSKIHPAVAWGAATLVGLGAAAWGIAQPPVYGAQTPAMPVMAATFFALGASVGAGVVAALASVVERRADGPWWTAAGLLWMGAFLSVMMRAHNGGFINVLIPWHWVLCGLAGVLLGRARHTTLSRGARAAASVLGTAAFAGQLVLSNALTTLEPILPTEADVEGGEVVLQELRERCDGPIFAPFAAWLPAQVGQAPGAHLIAIWDIDHKKGPLHEHMHVFADAMQDHHFVCVVDSGRQPLGYGVQKSYKPALNMARGPRPKTGWRIRPPTLYVPK